MANAVKRASDQVRVRRAHHRGHYDRDTINAVLDSGYLAHIGYMYNQSPFVTPMLYWREGDYVYWHGSTASRAMKATVGAPVCLTVSHLDGIVLAKSAFHHSANYRSAMLFGSGQEVSDPEAKTKHLKFFMDQQFPGRWAELRPVKPKELKATLIARMKIQECAAKIRTGPPNDDKADQDVRVWTGVLPISHLFSDVDCGHEELPVPKNVSQFIGRKI